MTHNYSGMDASPEQLSVLLNIAKLIGAVNKLDDLLDLLAVESARAMQADRCSIFMLDVKNKEVWSKVAIGEKATIRFPMDQGIAGDTIASGSSPIIPDAYTYPNFNAEIDKETGYKSKHCHCAHACC